MRNDKYAKAPVLYIQQRKLKEVQANMQHQYVSSKHRQPKRIEEGSKEQKALKKRGTSYYSVTEEEVREEEESEKEEKEANQHTRKSFQEMTIKEQLSYLANKPTYAPRVTCVIRTEGQTYHGMILDYQKDVVTIKSGRRNIEIPDEKIKHIRILSL